MSKPRRTPSLAMQLSTISPAPRRCASTTQSRVLRAVSRLRVDVAGELLHAVAMLGWSGCRRPPRRIARRIAGSTRRSDSGRSSAGELTDIFSAPAANTSSACCDRADSAGDAKRDIESARHARDPGAIHRASLGARGDIVEHEFIRALIAIAGGKFQNVADDAVVAKPHALDHLAVAHIETGNYAFGKNGCNSSAGIRFSSNALPLMAAAAPASARACKSRASRMPPEACHSICGWRRTASRYRSTFGPGQCAVAAHIRAQHVLERRAGEIRHRAPQRQFRLPLPAMSGDARRAVRVQPHVEGQRQALRAEVIEPGPHLLDAASRAALPITTRATPSVQHLRDRRGIAQSAAHLHLERGLRRQSHDDGAIAGAAVLRAPSRSTTCSQSAPRPRYFAASTCGIRRRSGSRAAKSPCSSRTQWPARKSMAGMRRISAAGAHRQWIARKFCSSARRRRRSARDGIARRRNCATARRR